MPSFAIDSENTIPAVEGRRLKDATTFRSESELRKATAEWPVTRLVEVWNKLPGVTAVKKFKDRKTACARIWNAVAPQKATGGAPAAQEAPEAARSSKTAGKGQKRATARQGGKTAKVLALLERTDGATLKELMAATGWQAHSVRGLISAALKKKRGLQVESYKREDGERAYSLAGR